MKKTEIIGLLLIIIGIAVGLYVGVWLCFIGGIIDIVEVFNAGPPIEALKTALGIFKIFAAGVVGWISALILILPGIGILKI